MIDTGVDVIDKMARHFSTKRKCARWPVSMFINLIDISLVNCTVLLAKLRNADAHHLHNTIMREVEYAMVDRHVRQRMLGYSNMPGSLGGSQAV